MHPAPVSTVHTSYLSSPANTLPDTEIHKDPGDGQGDGQRPADLTWLIQPICHLMHVAPGRTQREEKVTWSGRGWSGGRAWTWAISSTVIMLTSVITEIQELGGDCGAHHTDRCLSLATSVARLDSCSSLLAGPCLHFHSVPTQPEGAIEITSLVMSLLCLNFCKGIVSQPFGKVHV